MAVFQIEYNSEVLKQYRQATVIYPDASEVLQDEVGDTDIPVLYLLHGMNGNEKSWTGRTHLERLVRHTNLIIIMPNCDNGWYTNTASGIRYFDAIAYELPQVMRRFFPNMTTKREKTFIAGLSMGGYGAFKIALATNRFSWAGSFSGAIFTDNTILEQTTDDPAYWRGIFGELTTANINQHLLSTIAENSDKATKLYAWCGQEDFLFETNEKGTKDLTALGLDLTYKTSHGSHEWYYWEKQIEVFLEMLPITYVKEERLS